MTYSFLFVRNNSQKNADSNRFGLKIQNNDRCVSFCCLACANRTDFFIMKVWTPLSDSGCGYVKSPFQDLVRGREMDFLCLTPSGFQRVSQQFSNRIRRARPYMSYLLPLASSILCRCTINTDSRYSQIPARRLSVSGA